MSFRLERSARKLKRGTNKLGAADRLRKNLRIEPLEPRLVLDSTVVLNEIMYNPPGETDETLEWIELYNQLAVDMDVSDWTLQGGVDFQFPDGTTVPGRGYLVISADPAAFAAATGQTAVGPFTGRLNNAGDQLLLVNNDGRRMNEVRYGVGGDWPTAPDGSGASLAKQSEKTASHVAANWTFSPENGGTPGAANFVEPGTFVFEDLLPEAAPARALVPFDLDGSLGQTWIAPDYDDASWTVGTTGVGFDTGRRPDYLELLGLNLDAPPDGQSPIPMQRANGSLYIRVPFQINSDFSDADKLLLRMKYDDGFVAYINGTEVAHANAPGRDGNTAPLAWLSTATGSHRDNDAQRFQDFSLENFRDALVPGDNVLAIHALNRNAADDDLLIVPQIVAGREVLPGAGISLAINEIAPGGADDFWLELANDGEEPIDLGGFVLAVTGDSGGDYTLSAQILGPGDLLVVDQQQLGMNPAAGENVFLYAPEKATVVDGRKITGRMRGRSEQFAGRWLYPDLATPGSANHFQFQQDVVINEIMYHAPPAQLPERAVPPTQQRSDVVPMDAERWRYRQSAAPLPADWASTPHAVDGAQWLSGQGPIGFDQDLTGVLNTQLDFPALQTPPFITYYFEKDFDFSGSENPFGFELRHLIDGGAVFYLNGVEFYRFNIQEGEIDANTTASKRLRRGAELSDPIEIPAGLIAEGTNRLSVELHRLGPFSVEGLVMGARLALREQVDPGVPPVPFIESDEEWIELYNRGTSPVDLSGWALRDAVDYQFAEGTSLGPGEYLVVANDAETLAAKYPATNIAGDFSGVLSNHDDRIRLIDASKNPADEVHYYEGGRWPELADGGGSSLELRDPDADNTKAEAWAASDETGKSQWQTFTFRELSQVDVAGQRRAQFNEFIFGLLDSGQFLIDDIQVVQDPDGAAIQLIQNGTFQGDTIGAEADKWRIIGTHQGTVVADPDDPSNKVLHVTASGPHQYANDYGSTTFVDNTPIQDGDEYEFSFRAKWLNGSAQLNTRLFFSRAGHTTRFAVPKNNGTPGAANSSFQANIGPTYAGFGHDPIVPMESDEVTVSVQAEDPDGVASMTLWWRVATDWNSVAMTVGDDGVYTASIPPQSKGDMVQFYVEGADTLGATSTYPAAGADSRALYQVNNNEESRKPNDVIDTLRLIFLPEDEAIMYPASTVSNQMSNRQIPFTLVHNNTVFYDVGIRQTGSRFVRPNSGYKIQLHPDNAFYGVHDSIRIDLDRQAEIAIKQMINRAAGTKSSAYNDITYLVSPRSGHTHVVLLQLARYEALYLDEQFKDGSSGTKFELDDVVFPTSPRGGVEGPKTGTGTDENNDIGVNTRTVAEQGDNPEFYRGHVLIKSQRARDDYQSIVRLAEAIHLDGDELDAATKQVMDVDLWLREYAIRAFVGDWDSYGFRRPKNLRLYVRPEDGKVIPLFWDADQANFTETIYNRRESTSRLDEIRDIPSNLRLFWGNMLDMINRSFNADYISRWVDHYAELAGGTVNNGVNWSSFVRLVENRTAEALTDMESGRGGIPEVPFEITSNGGQDFQTDSPVVTLAGTGWVDVRQVYLQGSDEPLDVTWTDKDAWELRLPLAQGENQIVLEAFDYQGNPITTDAITVTSTVDNPVTAFLRVTEINYNPYPPTPEELAVNENLDKDDFEFVELRNTGNTAISLLGVQFTSGIQYRFPELTLGAGETGVLVRNPDAFRLRYGDQVNVLGQFAGGGLSNAGERLALVDGQHETIMDLSYDDRDPWPEAADGRGATLQLVDPAGTTAATHGKYYAWRGSTERGGSPGTAGAEPLGVVVNEVLTNTDSLPTQADAIELLNTTAASIDISGWFLSDSGNNPLKFQIPVGTTLRPFGYGVFEENDFNPNPANPAANHFGLSGTRGDDVWLVVPDGAGGVQSFADEVHFSAAAGGQSLGRAPNGSGRLAPMTTVTLGTDNAAPQLSSVVLSELNYQPESPTAADLAVDAALTSGDLEFVELLNTSAAPVDLSQWRIRGGVDFDFEPGTTLGAGETLLVTSKDPAAADNAAWLAAFRLHYGLDDGVPLVGGYRGQLADTGELVRLQRPGTPPADDPAAVPRQLADEVLYDNLAPWPTAAAGQGQSLTRTIGTAGWGSLSESWTAAQPSPGSSDFAPVVPGDSNGDGRFDQQDIVQVLQGGKYMTGEAATLAEGDWNGDGVFNQQDIVAALQAGNYEAGPEAADAFFAGLD